MWSCAENQFQCRQTDPKCISMAQFCNDHQDCTDGSDELPQLCGEMQRFKTFLLAKYQLFALDCCDLVIVEFTDNNTVVYQEHPNIFTTYEKASENVNGKSHYVSPRGDYVLAYSQCGDWMIQPISNRCTMNCL